MTDAAERESRVRAALAATLLAADGGVREAAFRYLSEIRYDLDLRPYEDLFGSFGVGDADSSCRGPWLVDDVELYFGSRNDRLDVLNRAIVNGIATEKHGRPIPRAIAVVWASTQGLTELRSLAVEYLPQVDQRLFRSLHLEATDSLFELTAGASEPWDANRVAVRRLTSIGDSDFTTRMDTNEGFRQAVLLIAQAACAPNLVTRERPGQCLQIGQIAARQGSISRSRLEASGANPTHVVIGAPPDESWLGQLQLVARRSGS